jgi:hypothetical protein
VFPEYFSMKMGCSHVQRLYGIDALRLCREGSEPRQRGRRRNALRNLDCFLFVEDQDNLLAQRVPARTRAGGDGAGEGCLLELGIAPYDQAGAGRERTAVDKADGEVRRQRPAVVRRRPADVAAVESVPSRGRRFDIGRVGDDVDQRVPIGRVVGWVD